MEVGYLQSTLKSTQCLKCGDKGGLLDDPFVMVVRSIRKHYCVHVQVHIYIHYVLYMK